MPCSQLLAKLVHNTTFYRKYLSPANKEDVRERIFECLVASADGRPPPQVERGDGQPEGGAEANATDEGGEGSSGTQTQNRS